MKIRSATLRPSKPHLTDEYTAYLASPAWADTRRRALIRANHLCQVCGATSGLEVHHTTYANLGSESWGQLRVLCGPCHRDADRRRAGARRGR